MIRNLLFAIAACTIAFGGEASAQSYIDEQAEVGEHREDKNTSANNRTQLSWNKLADIVGHKVRITMPDSEKIAGKVCAIEAESFMVDIQKTSKKSLYPKGEFTIQRNKLTSFELQKPTKRWRTLGIFLGLAAAIPAGLLVGNALAERDELGRPMIGFLATAITVPIAGYYVGRHADMNNWVVVEIK